MNSELKTKYICKHDRCVWKHYVGCGIWLCPFKYCIVKPSGKPLYHRIRK